MGSYCHSSGQKLLGICYTIVLVLFAAGIRADTPAPQLAAAQP